MDSHNVYILIDDVTVEELIFPVFYSSAHDILSQAIQVSDVVSLVVCVTLFDRDRLPLFCQLFLFNSRS